MSDFSWASIAAVFEWKTESMSFIQAGEREQLVRRKFSQEGRSQREGNDAPSSDLPLVSGTKKNAKIPDSRENAPKKTKVPKPVSWMRGGVIWKTTGDRVNCQL